MTLVSLTANLATVGVLSAGRLLVSRGAVVNGAAAVSGGLSVTGGATVSGGLSVTGGLTLAGPLDMEGFRIVDLGAPVGPQDAATKAYVDAIAVGGGAAGPPTSVQYNAGGPLGGDAGLTWASGPQVLAVSGASPRLIVGSPVADPGAALQLKTDAGPAPIQLSAAAASPSRLVLQSRAATAGAATAPVQTLRLADRTAAFCEVVLTGVVTAGSTGQANVLRFRFRAKRFDLGGGTTLSPITTDFADTETPGVGASVGVAGADVVISATGATGEAIGWDCTSLLFVSQAW